MLGSLFHAFRNIALPGSPTLHQGAKGAQDTKGGRCPSPSTFVSAFPLAEWSATSFFVLPEPLSRQGRAPGVALTAPTPTAACPSLPRDVHLQRGLSAGSPQPSSHGHDSNATGLWAPQGRALGLRWPFRERVQNNEGGSSFQVMRADCMPSTKRLPALLHHPLRGVSQHFCEGANICSSRKRKLRHRAADNPLGGRGQRAGTGTPDRSAQSLGDHILQVLATGNGSLGAKWVLPEGLSPVSGGDFHPYR